MSKFKEKPYRDALTFQVDIYERLLNLYSLIFRLTELIKNKSQLIEEIPEILVRATQFETCHAVIFLDSGKKEGFYSITRRESGLDTSTLKGLIGKSLSPSLYFDKFGYGALYVYPLTSNLELTGLIALGKEGYAVDRENLNLKEVEIILGMVERLIGYAFQREIDFTKCLPVPLLFTDLSGRVVYANDEAKEMLSSITTIVEGNRIESILPEFDIQILKEEKPYVGEISFRTSHGPKVYELSIYPIKDSRDRVLFKGITLKDITALKSMEEEFFYRGKMETLGMLSAGIAHDFNNILTSILGYVSMLKTSLSSDEKLARYADVIERSALRASNLTKHLLNFSRRHKKPAATFDLHAVLEDCLFLIGESFRDIEVVKDFDELQFLLRGDESEFQHVFLNLFFNAKDAMEGKGRLTVRTKKVTIKDKNFVKVSVEDTGQGMDEKIIKNIFKPHFSTKQFGSHLGIGLHRVEMTMKKYGGFIEVESERGKGTRFSLYIPLSSVKRPETDLDLKYEGEVQRSGSKRKILVVDDEEIICEMLEGFLSSNYLVRTCQSGEEALKILEREDFDLLILDIIMPGMKGDEVLRRLREMKKEIKVLVSSGYMQEERLDKIKRLGIDGFLQKPFRREEILKAVEEVLSEGS